MDFYLKVRVDLRVNFDLKVGVDLKFDFHLIVNLIELGPSLGSRHGP